MRWDREFVLGGHQDEEPCQWTVGSPAALRDGPGQRVGGQVLGRSDSHLRPCRPRRTPAPASLAPYACARAYARTRAACALCPACDISPADEERHLCPDAWRREIQSYSPISSKRWKISASNFWTGLGRGEFGQGRPGQAGAARAERGRPERGRPERGRPERSRRERSEEHTSELQSRG